MPNLSKEDIFRLFNEQPRKFYKKKGRFLSRKAEAGETVLTIVSGHLETLKRSPPDSYVLRNIEIGSSAEMYIIDAEKFCNRYEPIYSSEDCKTPIKHLIDGQVWYEVSAKGRCEAREFLGETIYFTAPWGEAVICESGDFLARPVPGDPLDIYRIERGTFLQTYSQESL